MSGLRSWGTDWHNYFPLKATVKPVVPQNASLCSLVFKSWLKWLNLYINHEMRCNICFIIMLNHNHNHNKDWLSELTLNNRGIESKTHVTGKGRLRSLRAAFSDYTFDPDPQRPPIPWEVACSRLRDTGSDSNDLWGAWLFTNFFHIECKMLLLEGNVKIENSVTVIYYSKSTSRYSAPQNSIIPSFQQKTFPLFLFYHSSSPSLFLFFPLLD